MKQTPENIVKRQVKDYLYWRGWFSFPIMQGLGAHRGIADRIAIKKGQVLFIEIKSKTGKLSVDQMRFKETIEVQGGHYIVARSCDDVEKYLDELEST